MDETTASNATAAASPPASGAVPAFVGAESAFAAVLMAHAAAGADRIVGGDGNKAQVVITPIEARAVLNLRTVPQPAPGLYASALGFELPTTAGRSAVAADRQVHALWTGPGDWLITCADADRPLLETRLRAALDGMTGALTDVGHGFAVLNLSGPAAVDVLAQGCGLDLDSTVFIEGACAMTALARMRVVIHRLPRGGGYDVYVARSFGESLWRFLTVAATEHGYCVILTPPAAVSP